MVQTRRDPAFQKGKVIFLKCSDQQLMTQVIKHRNFNIAHIPHLTHTHSVLNSSLVKDCSAQHLHIWLIDLSAQYFYPAPLCVYVCVCVCASCTYGCMWVCSPSQCPLSAGVTPQALWQHNLYERMCLHTHMSCWMCGRLRWAGPGGIFLLCAGIRLAVADGYFLASSCP